MVTEQQLLKTFPWIEWHIPVPVTVVGTDVRKLCCRICIAQQGLKADQVELVGFDNPDQFSEHLNEVHFKD